MCGWQGGRTLPDGVPVGRGWRGCAGPVLGVPAPPVPHYVRAEESLAGRSEIPRVGGEDAEDASGEVRYRYADNPEAPPDAVGEYS